MLSCFRFRLGFKSFHQVFFFFCLLRRIYISLGFLFRNRLIILCWWYIIYHFTIVGLTKESIVVAFCGKLYFIQWDKNGQWPVLRLYSKIRRSLNSYTFYYYVAGIFVERFMQIIYRLCFVDLKVIKFTNMAIKNISTFLRIKIVVETTAEIHHEEYKVYCSSIKGTFFLHLVCFVGNYHFIGVFPCVSP